MAVNYPRRSPVRDEPRDMVRVQLKPNDVRSYERSEVEGLKAQYPDAFIVGEQDAEEEAPTPDAPAKAQPTAPNKGRQTAPSKGKDD